MSDLRTKIPGIKASHAIITDECRQNRHDIGAFFEASDRVRAEYTKLMHDWPIGKGAEFHLVLTVDYPRNKT